MGLIRLRRVLLACCAFLLKTEFKKLRCLAFQPPDDWGRCNCVRCRIAATVTRGRELRSATKNVARCRIERTVAGRAGQVAPDHSSVRSDRQLGLRRSFSACSLSGSRIIVSTEERTKVALRALSRLHLARRRRRRRRWRSSNNRRNIRGWRRRRDDGLDGRRRRRVYTHQRWWLDRRRWHLRHILRWRWRWLGWRWLLLDVERL